MWVDLREGKLSWYKDGQGGLLVGVMPMVGSAVALLPSSQVCMCVCVQTIMLILLLLFCFRPLSSLAF